MERGSLVLTREQAAATLDEGQAALQALFAQLSPDEMVRPSTIGGGEWSARDLLSHIAFWEELAAQAVAEWRAGQRPSIEVLLGAGATDRLNADNQQRTAHDSVDAVQRRAEATHRTILELIRGCSDEQWRASPPYPDAYHATLADLLGGLLGAPGGPFRHAFAHLADLTAYVASVRRS
jgi:hypothetical protein